MQGIDPLQRCEGRRRVDDPRIREGVDLEIDGVVVKVDRVEWIYIPDSATAAAALSAGEADWWENLPADLIPLHYK